MNAPMEPTAAPTNSITITESRNSPDVHWIVSNSVADDLPVNDPRHTLWKIDTAPQANSAPSEPLDEPLQDERDADEPVGRADEPHHLDLAASGEDRGLDRVEDQQHRRRQRARSTRRAAKLCSLPPMRCTARTASATKSTLYGRRVST